ncbi:BsuBI/PstI family type II restriction endonuclease [Xanthomonas hortorum]|uniref:BsuBI/PstI family type II restriction endonuclease n=1 Tax=Xanthomonas hortorum TaxID=56454 RepID=UPI001F366A65|nr:BsuBI/PstI family type II restriction endonuclease [Xanthomonas hortorum]MCE4341668.1 restriction endonuclease [Xanthomonas hortorum pv. vitians]
MSLPDVPSLDLIRERLPLIFPEGFEQRGYATREVATRVIFVMFYAGAVEGKGGWLRPSQVTDMSDDQAALLDAESRKSWVVWSLSNKKTRVANPWYATNSREQVRDETIKDAFIPAGAVVERAGVTTTSSKPRYALGTGFAALFASNLQAEDLDSAIAAWQKKHLSKGALMRIHLVNHGRTSASGVVTVNFPNGKGVRDLAPGPSSVITKAVVEVFAPNFLRDPAVLWVSESGNKVVVSDDVLMKALGLNINPAKTLPDIILVDLESNSNDHQDVLVVFVEVVASDGPITRERKVALTTIALEAGFSEKNLAFLTAYQDRGKGVFKKGVSNIAWGSYIWFASEPDNLIEMHKGSNFKLADNAK